MGSDRGGPQEASSKMMSFRLFPIIVFISPICSFAKVPDIQKFEFMKQSMLQPSEPMNSLPFVNTPVQFVVPAEASESPIINPFGKAGQSNGRLAFLRKNRHSLSGEARRNERVVVANFPEKWEITEPRRIPFCLTIACRNPYSRTRLIRI